MPVETIGANVSNSYVREPAFTAEIKREQKAVEIEFVPEKKFAAQKPVDESVFEAIEKANRFPLSRNTEIQFSVHEKTKEIMVKIVDVNTHEVVKEIPPEKILDLIGRIMEMAGLIVDERR